MCTLLKESLDSVIVSGISTLIIRYYRLLAEGTAGRLSAATACTAQRRIPCRLSWFGADYEDGLGDILGHGGVANLTPRGGVDRIDVAVDDRGEGVLGTRAGIGGEEFDIGHGCHFIREWTVAWPGGQVGAFWAKFKCGERQRTVCR
jgi:hypothetical protein